MLPTLRWSAFRGPAGARILAVLASLALITGCSDNGSVPVCENCEAWDQLTAGLGRFPEPHPTNHAILVFSTTEKTPGASDANRQSDEDLWLTWIVNESDPTANPRWQITGDALGAGDNFYPRWSPDGTEIAFVHNNDAGRFEIWRVSVALPATPGDSVIVGTPEYIVRGRDPAWASADEIVYTKDDKLFSVNVGGARRAAYLPVQLSFDPPSYASSDDFVDRHPDFAPDGGGVFNSIGRQNTADVFVEAFEIDNAVFPPETTATDAYILYQPPGGGPTYPIAEGADTLRTPTVLRSLPVGSGGTFLIGVRLDSRLLADTTRITYCDTTITQAASLQPSGSDTLRYFFETARGTLRIRTMESNTTVFWTRADGLQDSGDFPQSPLIANAGEARDWKCVMSYEVTDGIPDGSRLEDFLVTGSRPGSAPYDTTVRIPPGDTTLVVLYPSAGAAEPELMKRLPPLTTVLSASGRSRTYDSAPGGSLAGLRAAGDLATVWRLEVEDNLATFTEILSARSLIQNPAISGETAGGRRYLAFVSNDRGPWELYVQRVAIIHAGAEETWELDGDPAIIATPGSSDNLDCDRNVFHPRFVPGVGSGTVRLIVAMSDCPDNGFEDIGFDDDPWAVGEIRLWQVGLDLP